MSQTTTPSGADVDPLAYKADLKKLLSCFCAQEVARSARLDNASSVNEIDSVLADMRDALDDFRSELLRITDAFNSRRNCMLFSCDDAFRLARAMGALDAN